MYKRFPDGTIEVIVDKGSFLISDVDLDLIRSECWHILDNHDFERRYVRSVKRVNGVNRFKMLHLVIAERMYGDLKGQKIEYVNPNKEVIDLRRSNLRIAKRSFDIGTVREIFDYYTERRVINERTHRPAKSRSMAVDDCCEYFNAARQYIYRMIEVANLPEAAIEMIERGKLNLKTANDIKMYWKRVNKHVRKVSLTKAYEDIAYYAMVELKHLKIKPCHVKTYFERYK